jgi:hypothetical protein
MTVATENISFRHERKLMRRLMQQDLQTRAIFEKYSKTTADILARYRVGATKLWTRSQALDQEITAASQQLKSGLEGMIRTNQQWAFMAANEKTDEILNDYIERLPVSNLPVEGLFARNIAAFDKFVARKVAGMGLSNRVWSVAKEAQDMLGYYLESGIATGRSANEMSKDIRQLLNKPDSLFRRVRNPDTGELELSRPAKAYHPGRGVYRSAYKNARRLAATETNMAYRNSDHERWKATEWILGFEVRLSNNHTINGIPFRDICDDLAGRYPKTFRFIGWHPLCRCFAVPILPSQDEMLDNVLDDKPMGGMVGDVPEGFKGWVAKHQEQVAGWKSQPYFIRDNFKNGRIENGLKMSLTSKSTEIGSGQSYNEKLLEINDIQSIKEAEQWALRNINTSGISYEGFDLGVARQINKSLFECENYLLGDKPIIIIKNDVVGKAYANYDWKTQTLNFRKRYNDIEKRMIADDEIWMKNFNGDYHAVSTFDGMIKHEYGHLYDDFTKRSIYKEIEDLPLETKNKAYGISGYASSDRYYTDKTKGSEMIAEIISSKLTNSHKFNLLPEEVKNIIDKYFKK